MRTMTYSQATTPVAAIESLVDKPETGRVSGVHRWNTQEYPSWAWAVSVSLQPQVRLVPYGSPRASMLIERRDGI